MTFNGNCYNLLINLNRKRSTPQTKYSIQLFKEARNLITNNNGAAAMQLGGNFEMWPVG
jgi:hypothetical protein